MVKEAEKLIPELVRAIVIDPTDFAAASALKALEGAGYQIVDRFYHPTPQKLEELIPQKDSNNKANFDVVFLGGARPYVLEVRDWIKGRNPDIHVQVYPPGDDFSASNILDSIRQQVIAKNKARQKS
ncbi:hypothetical protein HYW39_01970 [Candidatus Curtissbacteria bacterium]|nr:hypothetical protein [Candidatus Curtissbacteria bacterium]